MKKTGFKKVLLFLTVMVFFLNILVSPSYAQESTARIYGQDRIETSIEISKHGWEKGADFVVIAHGYNFADALCASPLAKKFNAPILLTESLELSDKTKNEIKRLNAKNIFIIGGTGVVSENIEDTLKKEGVTVERIGGLDRYETSLKVAKKLGSSSEIFITYGGNFADSISIASIAAQKSAPILFTDKENINTDILNYIKDENISKAYAIGGNGVISEEVVKTIPNCERISGEDRFETNKAVLDKFSKDLKFENIFVVRGEGEEKDEFADALAISVFAARSNSPIILTYKELNENLKDFLNSKVTKETKIVAVGGEKVVPESIVNSISNIKNQIKNNEIKDNNIKDNKPLEKGCFRLVVSKLGNELVSKDLKIEKGKTAMDYLKSAADVSESSGFITSINGTSGVKLKALSIEERKEGTLGLDWFIYVNGEMAQKGANLLTLNEGDTLTFSYRKWNWHDLVSPGYSGNMPVQLTEMPDSVKVGESFKVKAICVYFPVYGASVKVDGKEITSTDIDGYASITISTPGTHKVSVEKGGGVEEKSIVIKANDSVPSSGSGSQDDKGDEGKYKTILKQENGSYNLVINCTGNNKINLEINNKNLQEQKDIAITLYNSKKELAFIGQGLLENGKCKFNTKLEQGEYQGYYKESNGQMVEIKNFIVK